MTRKLVVTVTIEDRGDGGLRVTSEALPNLILSGSDKKKICDSIAPAIKSLLEYKGYDIATINCDQDLTKVANEPLPRAVDMNVHHRQFVVELRAVA